VPTHIAFCLYIRWLTNDTYEEKEIQFPRPLTFLYLLIIITFSFNAQGLEKYGTRRDIISTYYFRFLLFFCLYILVGTSCVELLFGSKKEIFKPEKVLNSNSRLFTVMYYFIFSNEYSRVLLRIVIFGFCLVLIIRARHMVLLWFSSIEGIFILLFSFIQLLVNTVQSYLLMYSCLLYRAKYTYALEVTSALIKAAEDEKNKKK